MEKVEINKVDSLMKLREVSITEKIIGIYRERNLNPNFKEVNLNLKREDRNDYKKVFSAVRRFIKNTIAEDRKDMELFLENSSNDFFTARIDDIDTEEDFKYHKKVIELMSKDSVSPAKPIKITIGINSPVYDENKTIVDVNTHSIEIFTSYSTEMKAMGKWTSRKLVGYYASRNRDYKNYADIWDILATVFLWSNYMEFTNYHKALFDKSCDDVIHQQKILNESLEEAEENTEYNINSYILKESQRKVKRFQEAKLEPFKIKNDSNILSLLSGNWGLTTGWSLLKLMVDEYNEVKADTEEQTAISRNYSSSFETLPNIKLSHLEKMRYSEFSRYFKHVELDNDVDLGKFDIVEKNLSDIVKDLGIEDNAFKNYNFKVRKLGKYKAAGIYSDFMSTLVIDLRSPDSFIHELFHLLDYKHGNLSSKFDFLDIAAKMEDELEKNINDGDPNFKTTWFGKTKYNRNYYLGRRELFARAGELYISMMYHNVKDNSLFKSFDELKKDYVYSFSDELLEDINVFFDLLFENIKKGLL